MAEAHPTADLEQEIAKTFGLQRSGWAEFGQMLMNALGGGQQRPQAGSRAPATNQPLPRIVPNEKGELVDLNTGKVVGSTGQQGKQSGSQPGFLQGLLNAVLTGMRHSGGQIRDDLSALLTGQLAPGQLGRMADVATELPIGKGIKAVGQNPVVQKAIDPQTWQSMSAEAKAMLTQMGNAFPELLQKVLRSPIPLQAEVPPGALVPGTLSYGQLGVRRPTVEMAKKVGDPELAKKPVSALMTVAEKEAKKFETPVHETQHMLSFPRVAATDPADAATIGVLLNEILPKYANKGSLTQGLGNYAEVEPWRIEGRPGPQLLQQAKTAESLSKPVNMPGAYAPTNAGQGYYLPGETLQDTRSRFLMDEGLSYLAEQTIPGFGQGPSPQPGVDLGALARQLGVGVGALPNPMQEHFPSQRIEHNQVLEDLLKQYGLQ